MSASQPWRASKQDETPSAYWHRLAETARSILGQAGHDQGDMAALAFILTTLPSTFEQEMGDKNIFTVSRAFLRREKAGVRAWFRIAGRKRGIQHADRIASLLNSKAH